jgi:hypothetical protein
MLTCVHRSSERHYRHSGRHRLGTGFPQGIPIVANRAFEDLLQITVATNGSHSVALTISLGSDCHKSQGPGLTLPRIRLELGTKEFFLWPDFCCPFLVLHLQTGLLYIEKLDWERVRKLGGKFLQLRLEDSARRYPGT